MHKLSVAIVDSNVLACIGLQQILENIMPIAEVSIFASFDELKYCGKEDYIHYFVASRIYFEHTLFFRDYARKSIILVNGDMQINGMMTINVCQSEKQLIKSLLALHGKGHGEGHPGPVMRGEKAMRGTNTTTGVQHATMTHCPHIINAEQEHSDTVQEQLLSPREIEVAVLLSKGCINKEIADKLNISVTTVITHRMHIMEKLHARSLADIIIYSVMNGFVEIGDL